MPADYNKQTVQKRRERVRDTEIALLAEAAVICDNLFETWLIN
jgi:hypothetical protein